MRVAERHVDAGVAQQLLHRLQRDPPHHQMTGEAVPQVVHRQPLRQAGLLADPGHEVAHHPVRQPSALLVAEDVGASKMPMSLEDGDRIIAERHLPTSAALR